MSKFRSMPEVQLTDSLEAVYPYRIAWYYPVVDRWGRVRAEHTSRRATERKALDFAVTHKIPPHRVPEELQEKLCRLARTVEKLGSVRIVRERNVIVDTAERSCPGSLKNGCPPRLHST